MANGIDQKALLADLRKQLTTLEDDLRERSAELEFDGPLRDEYQKAVDADRTAAIYETWRDDRVTQAAVAWLLGCVYVRFCEDNGLIPEPFLSGPGDALATAHERQEAFFRANPHLNDRDWLEAAFTHLTEAHPTAAGLFDRRYNPLWELTPSFEAATALLSFWRRRGPDGEVIHKFADESWNTRFLGDIYQDLSDHAKKTYALLQTPEFVEEFILDLTLTPALETFGLDPVVEIHRHGGGTERTREGLRTIDPACGSGHFLLGIFHRLLAEWRRTSPGIDDWILIRRSLESVHGCDKNPFAASIARFRLLVAALKASGTRTLASAGEFPINVAVGDSLLHGIGVAGEQIDMLDSKADEEFTYRSEDVNEYINSCDLLTSASYHVVVGNPPYITVKDRRENENYRARWKTVCSGKYALSVPFAARMFHLATPTQQGGYVGQITANSFMKREFGKKLIENFLRNIDLTHIIDTSGAYIPGHGTPTVIIIGRKKISNEHKPIRSALGIRGEPETPPDPTQGLVWQAIIEQISTPGSESDWISVADVDRHTLSSHPWSLSGGGADALLARIENSTTKKLERVSDSIGITSFTLEDDLYLQPKRSALRKSVSEEYLRDMITGDLLRDWSSGNPESALFPYTTDFKPIDVEGTPGLHRAMWPARTTISNNVLFGRKTKLDAELKWSEYGRLTHRKLLTPLSITYAEVSTHNHFVLDRGGRIFKQTAPVIKLASGRTEGEHLAILGLLNSSTACFWLKQVCHDKGIRGEGGGFTSNDWERFFQFNATKLQQFPLPAAAPARAATLLDALSRQLADTEPSVILDNNIPSRESLENKRIEQMKTRAQMISIQEESDWEVYKLYGITSEIESSELQYSLEDVPEIALGERAFEISIARRASIDDSVDLEWFDRHGSKPITELPEHWPEAYKQVVEKRIETINSRRDIALIERPECKRRWATEPWEKKERKALETWLLDKCEDKELWFALRDGLTGPRTLTVSQLADLLRTNDDVNSVAALYAADHLGKRDLPLADVLEQVIATEHVPYLAAMRYKETGLRKRAQWESVWEEQRKEDRTGKRLDIKVPPKYTSADFAKTSYWSHRGKLDVPKERFISYPGAGPEADPTLLLGWAGWDHKDQALALVNVINDRLEQEGWETDKIAPLLAGLAELMPWVKQWHAGYDAEWGGNPAEEFQTVLEQQQTKHGLTDEALSKWRPEQTRRGRRKS
ncbi:BREX-2 system adenine-specific DNA-methyltransferase PglX [Amycolatopsis azurea]|uniref:site-specific DNA-methyltransferase (adenine-specific) n=1 Tax=Amycolatopsis azurea DSM 43854 TaxID=1238180 RepID=M2QN27_9PSEU|nr:BREX-2 system adenine-specific DNA-methyltransferase PglX [Amycolatopsis azurea]EMD27232.1 putative DNA methylase [Amycolatopsis azurea DSM 43854]OOC03888.1 SAM-dependent methyltransferase [Amycolatopsis azurea DSM 43854]